MNLAIKIPGVLVDANVRAVIISEGRAAVESAFRHWQRPGESPVAYFGGAHRPTQPRRSKARPRTQVMHAVATRPSGRSKPPIPDQPIAGFVHRAISELPPLEFVWVQYQYRPWGSARKAHGESFLREFFARYSADHLTGCKTGTRRMVRYLIAVAMDDNYDRDKGFLPQHYDLPPGFDIDRRNWNKTYLPHWRRICTGLRAIDNEALYKIGEKVGEKGAIA